jgi:hypothetical protein
MQPDAVWDRLSYQLLTANAPHAESGDRLAAADSRWCFRWLSVNAEASRVRVIFTSVPEVESITRRVIAAGDRT